jgi:HAMP domain-containing protein
MKVNPQTATQALDILRQAEATGREVTVNKRGEVAFAGRTATLIESLRARINGSDWAASRQVERNQRVLDAFGKALSNDFAASNDPKIAKVQAEVFSHVSYTFNNDYRNGVLPEAAAIADEIAKSFAKALNKMEKKANALADRAVTDFAENKPSEKTQQLLSDVAKGIEVGGGEPRVELEAMRKALEARTEKLGIAYCDAKDPSDEEAAQLRDHVRALANLTEAIRTAVNAGRNANESSVPQFDSGNGRGEMGRVRFAGVDNNKNTTTDALDGDEIRAMRASKTAKGVSELFSNGLRDTEAKLFAKDQEIAEGSGIRGEERRTRADSVAANRMWTHYEDGALDDDGNPDTRTVRQFAKEEVSAAEANAFQTKAERKQAVKLAAQQAQEALANGTAPKAPQKPIPADTWIISAFDKDGPIRNALRAAGLDDDAGLRSQAINAFTNQLIKESDASVERRVIGYTPDEVNAMAKSVVENMVKA